MKDVNTEKHIHLRNLKAKKREVSKELQIALEKIEEEKYEELHKKKTEEKKSPKALSELFSPYPKCLSRFL